MIALALYTRKECRLCDEMKAAIGEAAAGVSIRLDEIDVDSTPELAERFGADVPVLFVAGKEFARHRLDRNALRDRLRREVARSASPGGGA